MALRTPASHSLTTRRAGAIPGASAGDGPFLAFRLLVLLLGSVALLPGPLTAAPARPQEPDSAPWNSPRVLDLIAGGREARAALVTGGTLESYQAMTEGHIYFFVDPEVGERALIRIDQVAVELRWQAPDRVQQHIVGERSEVRLPVRDFRYYLDRLTLVQYGFGNEIRIGSGMDVAGVPHPLAPTHAAAPDRSPYDFRLADSLSLSLPGRPEPLRLYEIEVRPKDPDSPGILGVLTLDRDTRSVVRMAFTFTPASYVDPRTDRIAVEVDYGLWEDRFWLPNLQQIEVRREIPELDLGVGTVIRSVLRTRGYVLNVPLPERFETFPRATQLPLEARQAYAFQEGLYDGLERDGLARLRVDADPRQLRAEGMELLRQRPPSGLPRFRLHLPRISSGLRFSRSEGLFLGMGGSTSPTPVLRLRGHAGYGFAAREPQGRIGLEAEIATGWRFLAEARARERGDLGLVPGIDPLLSTLGGVFAGEDYRDPYRITAGVLRLSGWREGGGHAGFAIGIDRVWNAELRVDNAPVIQGRSFRAVRPITPGEFLRTEAQAGTPFTWPAGGRGWAEAGILGLSGIPGEGIGLSASAEGRWGRASGERELTLLAHGWSWHGDPLPQGHRLLGGRNTLPGFAYRSFVGQSAAAASLVGATDASGPLLRLRGGVHAAWSGRAAPLVAQGWDASATRGIRASLSVGLGVGWDLVRVDLARGLNGGEWQLLFSLDPLWWDRL